MIRQTLMWKFLARCKNLFKRMIGRPNVPGGKGFGFPKHIDNGILVVAHEAQNGGASMLSYNIIKHIKENTEFNPVVLLIAGGTKLEDFKELAPTTYLAANSFSEITNEYILRFELKRLRTTGVKTAICNSLTTGVVQGVLKEYGFNIITMVHELPTSIKTYDFEVAGKLAAENSDEMIFAANFVRDGYTGLFGYPMEKCHIIPQGVYAKDFLDSIDEKTSAHSKLAAELGLSDDSKIVLGCGYYDIRKGVDLWGMIAKKLINMDKNIHFVWLGGGDDILKAWVINDLELTGVSENVHWVGQRSDPMTFFKGADLYLLTSREDPFPSVVLEAMHCFTPVITFENNGGAMEAVADGRGYVVPYADVDAMVDVAYKSLSEVDNDLLHNAKEYVKDITMDKYLTEIIKLAKAVEDK